MKNRNDEREKLEKQIEKAERMRRYYSHKEKILERKVIPELTRKERTRRLCIRAGMLESFLGSPELLSNEQVMELLKIAFHQEKVKDALLRMLEAVNDENDTVNQTGRP